MRSQTRRLTRRVLYSPARQGIIAVTSRVHNHLYNCSTDAATNGETWLIDRFPDRGVFLDVGFNEGDWSVSVASGNPGRSVHGFDPARSVIEALDHAASNLPNFSFHPIALSDVAGQATFHEYGVRNGSSSLGDRRFELGEGNAYDVTIDALDAWAERESIDHITVLKVDAEGFDLNVMEGAWGLFNRGAIDLVVFEYASGWFSSGRSLMEAAAFIESTGYRLCRLFPEFVAPYTYRVQHEGAAMIGYFVAVRPGSWAESGITIRPLQI